MSDDYDTYTRVNRFEKKRKNTKAISLFSLLGGLLVIVLIAVFIFGNNGDTQAVNDNEHAGSEETNSSPNQSEQSESDQTPEETDAFADADENSVETGSDEDEQSDSQDPNDVEVEKVPFDDENVLDAYTADWDPIGTEIEEPFEFSWEQGEQDWQELMKASAIATGLSEDDVIDWWVTSDGPQKVVATITNKAQTENYRVYVSWVSNEGWVPTKVEILKENDQKDRFAGESESLTSNDDGDSTTESAETANNTTITDNEQNGETEQVSLPE